MPATDTELTEIPIRLKLSKAAKEKLTARAAESGLLVDEYASELLEEAVTRPSADELLAPFRKQVADSGVSDEELDNFFRREIDAVRREKKAQGQ